MARLLPFAFLVFAASLFGELWIVLRFDPKASPWFILVGFVILLFFLVFGFLGLLLYFARTRMYRRYSANWYFYTSFKMAFFVALFIAIAAALAILALVNTFNVFLAISSVSLFALWSYLGRKK